MKKGILCILLSILMLVPMFASCSSEVVIEDVEANIYTLYTIKDEETTPEAIRQVELALNRILFHRLGVILKLVMVNEDEYDQLIADKYAEVEEYRLAKKENKDESSEAESSTDEEVSIDVMTGDDILDILEEGGEIPLEEPRLDIFLVRGYDKYYDLATNGKLASLDEKLNNEGKALKSSIHSTLFTAAKVGNKTYGVPVNNAIGEYTYLVYDADLLAQHNVDPNTLTTLEDLRDYLDVVKKNNPDVVPLKNVKESTAFNFLSNEGFPALVLLNDLGKRHVVNAYKDSQFNDYYSMIARYNALGYISDSFGTDAEEDANTRYAVRFESGTIDSITKNLQKEYGKEQKFEFTEFSPPIATNENTIDNIFCVSEFVSSTNELTEVIEIMEAINTDAQLMNILTYGVENVHYQLDDDGFVVRKEDVVQINNPENPEEQIVVKNVYIVDPNHVGNCFITHILKDTEHDTTNANLWTDAIKQNQDAIVSPSLGFTSNPKKFSYKVTVEVEDPDNPGTMIEQEDTIDIYEPDYFEVINEIVDKYYPALLAGNAVEFNYEELYAKAEEEITADFVDRLDEQFEENVLKPIFAEKMREEVTKNQGKEIREYAEAVVREDLRDDVKKKLKNKLNSKLKAENPDKTNSEINAMVKELLTDELIDENFPSYYTEEEILEQVEIAYKNDLEAAIDDAIDDIEDTEEYDKAFNDLRNSEEYQNQLNLMLSYDAPNKIIALVDDYIADAIAAYTDNIIAEIETAIEATVNTFIEENAEVLGLTKDEIYVEIGYFEEETVETEGEEGEAPAEDEEAEGEGEGEGEGEAEPEKTYVAKYETWFDFVFQEKIVDPYYLIFGDPNKVA